MSVKLLTGINLNGKATIIRTEQIQNEIGNGNAVEAEIFADATTQHLINSEEKLNLNEKLNQICRCCLSARSDLKPIYSGENSIASMIFLLTSIQVSHDDGLPSKICLPCMLQLTKCVHFKQQIYASDMALRNYISEGYVHGMELQTMENEQLVKTIVDPDDNLATVEDNHHTYDISSEDEDNGNECDEIISQLNDDVAQNSDLNQSFSSIELDVIHQSSNELDEPIVENIVAEKKKSRRKTKSRINVDVEEPEIVETSTKRVRRKQFSCTLCDLKFHTHVSFSRHIKTHSTPATNNNCSICSRKFRDAATLESHTRCHQNNTQQDASKTSKTYKCNDCEMVFTVEHDLYVHGSIHVNNGKYICRKCEKEFPNIIKLKRHVRIHFEDKPYKCEECGRGFPEMGSLTRHYRLHTGEKREKKHVCTVCGKGYYDSHSLSVHLRTHTGEKPWVCKKCGKAFIDSRLLNSHTKTHLDEKPYPCNRCGRRFTHQSTLTTHIRTHTGEKPYVCYICSKKFIQSSNLSLHIRVHSGEKPYKCSVCERQFASSSTLTMHMRTHTGEKPYNCPECGKSFARHDLKAHMRTHTGEKPFACSQCSRKFTTSGQLNQHMRTHTGEKPYECNVCDQKCATSSSFKKHMKIHETNDTEITNPISTEISSENEDNHSTINSTETILVIDNSHILDNSQQDELQSDDAEFNENAALVNDLLAAVVNAHSDNLDNSEIMQVPVLTTIGSSDDLDIHDSINPRSIRISRRRTQIAGKSFVLETLK